MVVRALPQFRRHQGLSPPFVTAIRVVGRRSIAERRSSSALFVLGAMLGLVIVNSCTESKPPARPRMTEPTVALHGLTHDDSVAAGYFLPRTTAFVAAADVTCDPDGCPQLVSADPASLFQGFNQPGPVTLQFSGPVGSVTVVGSGAIECDAGQYGILVGYDSTGVELGRTSLHLIDPADCSPESNPDDVTFGAAATLVSSTTIARAVILPMSPLVFPVLGQCCGHASATYSVSFASLPPAPKLSVNCPSSAVRGDAIACNISVTPATLAFTITGINAQVFADGAFTALAIAPPPSAISAGQVYKLEGPAIASTTLTVDATVTVQGQARSLTKDVSFSVTARPTESADYIMTLSPEASGPGRTQKYPTVFSGGGALGLYARQPPDWSQVSISTAGEGPNKGLSYINSIPGIPASLIYLTFAIFPGDPWYTAHPTNPGPLNSLGLKICTQSQIDNLRLQVERHEGITMATNSHFGIDQDLLRQWKFARLFGSMVSAARGTAEAVKQQIVTQMATEWQKEAEVLEPLQHAFDGSDTPAIFNSLGCSIYLD